MVRLSDKDRLELIKRNTLEIIGERELDELLKSKKKLSVYLGTAPTGRPHLGYMIWILKLADLLRAGFKVKVLLADLHALLDGVGWEELEGRYKYYEVVIPEVIKAMGVDVKGMEFVKGSDFELDGKYMEDLLRMSTNVSVRDATKAASEVVKLGDNPKLSGLIYPLMQALDEEYLKVDMQLGGGDQRKIFVMAREQHPKIGYKARIEMMTPILPGLIGEKMSASDPNSKIDFLDNEDSVMKKMNKAYCLEGEPDNGVMAFLEYVLMVIKNDKGEKFMVERPDKFGGDVSYSSYEELEKDFVDKKLHPMDLKNAVAKEINELFSRMDRGRLKELSDRAYK
jgi:tyrosyl-tRNA synthetase